MAWVEQEAQKECKSQFILEYHSENGWERSGIHESLLRADFLVLIPSSVSQPSVKVQQREATASPTGLKYCTFIELSGLLSCAFS